jgi:hypothetical protein
MAPAACTTAKPRGIQNRAGSAHSGSGKDFRTGKSQQCQVRVAYLPSSFVLGAGISVGTIMLCAIRFAWGLLRRRRRLREDPTLIGAPL